MGRGQALPPGGAATGRWVQSGQGRSWVGLRGARTEGRGRGWRDGQGSSVRLSQFGYATENPARSRSYPESPIATGG